MMNRNEEIERGVYRFASPARASRFSFCPGAYALEIGAVVKIGRSARACDRIAQVASNARNYSDAEVGRAAIFGPVQEPEALEAALHEFFAEEWMRGELFRVPFTAVCAAAEKLLPQFPAPLAPAPLKLVACSPRPLIIRPAAPVRAANPYPFWLHRRCA